MPHLRGITQEDASKTVTCDRSGIGGLLVLSLRTTPTSEEEVAFSGSIIFSKVVDMSTFSLRSDTLPYPVLTL